MAIQLNRFNNGLCAGNSRRLLAGLAELIPWLKQWNNEGDAATGVHLGDCHEVLLREEARYLALTLENLPKWQMPENSKGRGRAKS